MDDLALRRLRIETLLRCSESFWEYEVPEAVVHEDWSDFDMLNFTLEVGLPYDHYARLIKELGEDLKGEYAERLARLDALIAQNEPGLKQLLDEVFPCGYTGCKF